jgi:nucleoside phosphorylase
MIRVMLVDDGYEKARSVGEIVNEVGGVLLSHETTAIAARRRLRNEEFDLLLVDMSLPENVGSAPSDRGGLSLVDLLYFDSAVLLPHNIVFITAKEELMADVSECSERGATLCRYSGDSNAWREVVKGQIKFLQGRQKRSVAVRADVVIVTALRDPELSAVLALPYEWQSSRIGTQPTTFHFGRVRRDADELTIVAACTQRKGMPSAAALAAWMAANFKPRYLLMTGICAGVRGKTNLGDVIVADPTWDWGSGKKTEDDQGSPVFRAAPHQRALNARIADVARECTVDEALSARIRAGWKHAVPGGTFNIRVGPMASGASVVADRTSVSEIAGQQRDLLGIEMEAYAVMAAAEYAPEPTPIGIVIKSVCDYADPEKADNWQAYAAYTSAAFADHLLRDSTTINGTV